MENRQIINFETKDHYLQLPKEILDLIPAEMALRYQIIPLGKDHDQLMLAHFREDDFDLINELRFILGQNFLIQTYPVQIIQNTLAQYYSAASTTSDHNPSSAPSLGLQNNRSTKGIFSANDDSTDDISVVQTVNQIISEAIQLQASDIHIEPYEYQFRVRYRMDGVLQEVKVLPLSKKQAIISRLKIMAELDIAEKRRPQDGRIRISEGDKTVDIRVSTLPTDFGEKVVLRIWIKPPLIWI